MPCFYSSHFLIYACDDFTFGNEDPEDHPSSVICQEMADVILFCHMQSDDTAIAKLKSFTKAPIVPLQVTFKATKSHCFIKRPVIPLDDPYPCLCNCQESMATWIATQFKMVPIDMRPYKEKNTETLFYEPQHLELPSMMHPSPISVDAFEKLIENKIPNYGCILTTAMDPIKIEHAKEVLEVKFTIDLTPITTKLINLPPHVTRLIKKKTK